MCKGWIKDYRQEMDSVIWEMPPLYHRLWQYLKYSACYEEKKIPMTDGTILKIMPGQVLTSLRNIASSIGWYERGIRKDPNPKTVEDVLEWLEKQDMIAIDHGNGGKQYTLITIINWNKYQVNAEISPEASSQSNMEETQEKQSLDIYNNNKEYKEDKEPRENKEKENKILEENICVPVTKIQASSEECDKNSKEFEEFWNIYPRKIEKKKAYRVFKARIKEKISPQILINAAKNYDLYCKTNGVDSRYIKHPSTFLGADKAYEEYANGYPLSNSMPVNIKNALDINKKISNGEQMEVQLW